MIVKFLIKYILIKEFKIPSFYNFLFKNINKLEVKDVVWLDTLDRNIAYRFTDKKTVNSYSPKDINNHFSMSEVILPQVSLYRFQDVIVNTRSSHFIKKNAPEVVFERVLSADTRYCNYATGFVRCHNDENTLIKFRKNKKNIGKILYLGGNGVFNYYHWLIEIAPKILFLTPEMLIKHDIDTLLLDKSIKEVPSFHKILHLLLDFKKININIIYECPKTEIHAKDLYYINNINNVVFNAEDKISCLSFSCFCFDLIRKTKDIILQDVKKNSNKDIYPKKIFLARHDHAARRYNQPEVLSYFEGHGFQAIYLEELDFFEQVTIFNQADFIIGPSGAAWANIIFCRPNVKAISWLPEHLSEFSVFSTLAHYMDCDLRFVFTQADNVKDIHSSYHVELGCIIEVFEKIQ